MPVVTVRAGSRQRSGRFDALVRKATEKASDLLEQGGRVLVVYENETASIYYEGDGQEPAAAPAVPRPS